MSDRSDGFFNVMFGAIVVGVVVGIITIIGVLGGFDKTTGGEVAVVRNGGLLDNHKIRQVIDPASGLTWTGFWSSTHKYPAQQRFYTITADQNRGDRAGVDVVHTPSADGVNVGIEGTVYFTLNLDHGVVKQFDNKFGTRKFRGQDGQSRYPYDGDDGWSGFLDQIVRPVIENDLREQIGSFRCAQLVSSCSLVQNNGSVKAVKGVVHTNANIAEIQRSINSSLEKDLKGTLGGDFLTNIRFNLVRVTLPPKVQDAVDNAQSAFAQVSQSQARVQQARLDAQANRIRQKGYKGCPACAAIDQNKSIPSSITVWAPGGNYAVTGNGK